MSKAFTSEENEIEDVIPTRIRPALPPGTKNYITRAGAEAFQALTQKLIEERAGLVGSTADGAKERIVRIDARLRDLDEITSSVTVVEAPPNERDRVRFGATITVLENGERNNYRIVGIDEADLDENKISWLSPLAKALMNKRAGDRVKFATPAGMRQIDVLSVAYE